jgi:hypothetical protein
MRLAKIAVLVGLLAIVPACKSGRIEIVEVTPVTASLAPYKSVSYKIEFADADGLKFAGQIESNISNELRNRGIIQDVLTQGGDLLFKVMITNFRHVSAAGRAWGGIYAGKARCAGDITIVDNKSGVTLGVISVGGKAGNIYWGTTDQAIQQFAFGLADYLAPRKK